MQSRSFCVALSLTYLRPDSKSQVTIEYSDDNIPQRIDAIVVSTQHDDFDEDETMLAKIRTDIINILIPRVIAKLPDHIQALFSDDIIYHPVQFKLLFGSKAIPTLRAKFKVVKRAGSFVSDNEVRSRVVTATDLFFANANYNFGDTFYWTELSAFIHLQLSNLVSSIVIVAESTDGEFGDLFQITSGPDEILLHDLTVDDVVVVDSINQSTLSNWYGQ